MPGVSKKSIYTTASWHDLVFPEEILPCTALAWELALVYLDWKPLLTTSTAVSDGDGLDNVNKHTRPSRRSECKHI
jgi:hypothetical protein